MSIIRDFRFMVLMLLLLISAFYLVTPYVFAKSGVVVSFVDADNKCKNIIEGDSINQVGGSIIRTSEDFDKAMENIKANDFVSMVVNGKPSNCVAIKENYIGIIVKDVEVGNLKFGIDIEGGTRVLLKPKGNVTKTIIEETISTLNARINLFGLKDVRVTPLGENLIQIEMSGASGEDIRDFLAKQGKFEGKILESINLQNNTGRIILGDNTYTLQLQGNKILVNNSLYSINQSFYLENIKFDIFNTTNSSAFLLANTFTGTDIVNVFTDPEHSAINPVSGGYQFTFTIGINIESAQRFAKITKNQPIRFVGSEQYIDPVLVLFLDQNPVSELNIVASLAGQEITQPSIQGFRETRDGAITERARLQAILKSGSLPTELEIAKIDTITETAGKELINSTLLLALGAALAVSVIIFIRYRDLKIAIPMILISFSEIALILGFAAMTQVLTGGGGWVLDIPAIAGLIAVIGTGVNQLIIITDQMLLEQDMTVKFRHKTAMNIIFTSAYIVIAAMIPLILIGIGTLKGFAITTIIGVLIGIIITRPAYMAILERVKKLY